MPFLAFLWQNRHGYPPPAEKTATEAHRRPDSPAAPSRPSALRPVACPVARPLGLAPLWARGRGVCSAPFGRLRPAAVPPACAPCSSLPSASAALLMRPKGAPCADGREWAADNRALVPPGLRRRRPPRRRAAVRVRGRAAAGRGVEVGRLPRPLAVSAPSVWSAWPLAALFHASARRAGAWPVRPSGAAAARLRPLAWPMAAALAVAWGRAGLFISRRVVPLPPPRPRGAPPFPSSGSPPSWGRPQAEILAGAGAQPPASFGRWPKSVARGARALPSPLSLRSASRPLAVRAPLAAPCAPSRAFARRSPPSSGGQVRAVMGAAILQREHMGDGHAPPALRSPPWAAIWPKPGA